MEVKVFSSSELVSNCEGMQNSQKINEHHLGSVKLSETFQEPKILSFRIISVKLGDMVLKRGIQGFVLKKELSNSS